MSEPFKIEFTDRWEATITPATLGAFVEFHAGLMAENGVHWRPTIAFAERYARAGIVRRNRELDRSSRSYTIAAPESEQRGNA